MNLRIGKSATGKPALQLLRTRGTALPGLNGRAQQAELFAEQLGGRVLCKLRPLLDWLGLMRRKLATAGVAALAAWLFVHVMFGANGMVVYRQKKAEYQTLQKEVQRLQKGNDQYTRRIQALKSNPEAIEKEAREQLHYARPGEIVYVSPAPPPPVQSFTKAAQK